VRPSRQKTSDQNLLVSSLCDVPQVPQNLENIFMLFSLPNVKYPFVNLKVNFID
jgi:hypothetical protein